MPTFRYRAVDSQGRPVSGKLEGAGREEAIAKLTELGVDPEQAELQPVDEAAFFRGRLSAEDAAELAGQVAELAKAGLPLAPGLRALAEETPRRGVASALRGLAGQLEAGASLEAAFKSQGSRLPAHLRGLILAGIRSGRLPQVLERFVAVQRDRIELRRRLWMTLAYPVVLFSLLLALFVFINLYVVPKYVPIFEQFEAELPAMTQLLVWTSTTGVWILLGLVAVVAALLTVACTIPRPFWPRRFLYTVPVIGPLWRASGLVEFSRLMELLLGQRVPLPEALRLTAFGLRAPELAAACRAAAREVEAGRPLSECIAGRWPFPATLRPMVAWGQKASNLPEAFRAAGEMFEGRIRVHHTLLECILPPIVFLFIVGGVSFLLLGLFMPMFRLVQALS